MKEEKNDKFYVFNLETTKIELYFEKSEYEAFTEEQKRRLKGAFLFSGRGKCWVSRAKEPNLYRAKEVAKYLGFAGEKREGERLSFAEQLEKKEERAEERAERYESYAENAENRAVVLQKPLKEMHGDIAFFTQPIIAGHSGSQAFARRRQAMFDRYNKGFEEYRKSDYFKNRANIARSTASMSGMDDKGYIDRRIKECQKEIRQCEKNIAENEKILVRLESGEKINRYDGSTITIEDVVNCLNREIELVEVLHDKEGFYLNRLDELGGIEFSKENIKIGFHVLLKRWGLVEVIGRGTKNITFKILTGGAAGGKLKTAYAEILEVV